MPKISALTSLAQASVDTAADVLPIVDATAPTTTKKVTVQAMVNAGLAAVTPQGGTLALTGALTVSGTSTLGVTRVSGGDTTLFGISGVTKGIRFVTAPGGSSIEGVDNTLVGSYQPLIFDGSQHQFRINAGSPVMQVDVGQVSFVSGTAAAPSITFGGDTNTGIFRLQADTVGIAGGGVQVMRIAGSAGNVNGLFSYASNTGVAPVLRSLGSDTNVGLILASQGAESVDFYTNSAATLQFRVAHTASAVNCFSVTGSAAGGFSNILESIGTDSNIQNLYASKGTSGHVFRTGGSAGFTQFLIGHAASAVNYWQVAGAAAGGLPTFTMQGSDANVSAYMATKGTGSWRFATGGGDQFRIVHATNAVNYWSAYGAATGSGPILYADGSDAAMNANYSLKGSGSHVFYTGGTSLVQMVIGHVASTVNWPVISGSATGNAVTISTNGSDANRSIAITPAGTGGVVVGTTTLTAGAVFEVRDSADGTNFIVGGSGTTNLLKVAAGSADAMALYVNNTTEVLRLETAGGARLAAATAIPAGGTAGLGYMVSSSTNFGVFFGSGAPTLSAAKGSLYLRSDGTGTSDRAYINADGGTTWTALTTAA